MLEVQLTHTIGSAGMGSVIAEVRVRRLLPSDGDGDDDADTPPGDVVVFLIRSNFGRSSNHETYVRYIFWEFIEPKRQLSQKSHFGAFADHISTGGIYPHYSQMTVHCTRAPRGVEGRNAALSELSQIGASKCGYRPMFRAAVGELHQALFRTYARVLLRALRALHLRREPIRRARARAAIEHLESSSGGCGGAALVIFVAAFLP